MVAKEILLEIRLLNRDIVAFQHTRHPMRPAGVNLNMKARARFADLNGMWQENKRQVHENLTEQISLNRQHFELQRRNIFSASDDRSLKWATNRIQWRETETSPDGSVDLGRYIDQWFNFRMDEIQECSGVRSQVAGPRYRKSRIEMMSALSAIYLGVRALDDSDADFYKLGQLSKSSLRLR